MWAVRLLCLFAVLAAAGCTAGIKGRSDSPQHLAGSTSYYAGEIAAALAEAAAFKDAYYDRRGTQSWGGADQGLALIRNDFAFRMLAAHELALQDFARSLSVEGRGGLFATNLAALGLAAASAVTPSAALGAATTGVLGLQETYSRDLLLEKSVDFVLMQMIARHLEARQKVVDNLALPVARYPLSAVELDLSGLGRVTSFEVALAEISAVTGSELREAQNNETAAVPVVRFDVTAARELEDVLCVAGTQCAQFRDGALPAATACIAGTPSLQGVLLVDLLDRSRAGQRRALLDCLVQRGFQ